jgi:hypothetical protein
MYFEHSPPKVDKNPQHEDGDAKRPLLCRNYRSIILNNRRKFGPAKEYYHEKN